MTVHLDGNFPNDLNSQEPQIIWLNTDFDSVPEYQARIYYNSGTLYRVYGWNSPRTQVACDGDQYGIGIVYERLHAKIPRSCLHYTGPHPGAHARRTARTTRARIVSTFSQRCTREAHASSKS